MGSDVVIRAEGLGKKYVIGHQAQGERYTTLRDSVTRSFRAWGRSARDIAAGRAIVAGDETEDFWALKDVSFEIKRGDVVGVIGRNGAGKSTLLKVLSRITEPTEGRVTIDGRVASLLEVGTGFHAELSGRENIFLNGAILGMTREEIRKKFDEIVAFAGVEKFLDTPVKRYSSGMYVRLAFAVAAHLEPEILIVDEVLAVGDAEFQKKCLGKMQDVAGQGRTVLFVSHNISAMQSLCKSGLYLKYGAIHASNSIQNCISLYFNENKSNKKIKDSQEVGKEKLSIEEIEKGLFSVSSRTDDGLRQNYNVGIVVRTVSGIELFETNSGDHALSSMPNANLSTWHVNIPMFLLRPGEYEVAAYSYLQGERWILGKDDGPRLTITVPAASNSTPQYFDRPSGVGPLIEWKKHDSDNAE